MDTWISDTYVIKMIWKLKNLRLFHIFQSLGSWPIESWVIARFFESLGLPVYYLFPASISFAYTSRNPISMEFPRKDKRGKSEPYNYVTKCASHSCKWLLLLVTQWLDQLDHQGSFVWISISRITWIKGSLIHFSK